MAYAGSLIGRCHYPQESRPAGEKVPLPLGEG